MRVVRVHVSLIIWLSLEEFIEKKIWTQIIFRMENKMKLKCKNFICDVKKEIGLSNVGVCTKYTFHTHTHTYVYKNDVVIAFLFMARG